MNVTTLPPAAPMALVLLLVASGCASLERDNPFDARGAAPEENGTMSLAVPLPKALATVVDSLVARLDVPGAPPVVKELSYDTPLGPAILTIGALSPGEDITLTIEGYDLDGRLILTGTQTGITVVADDTTRISIDLRLAIAREDLEAGGDAPAGGAAADSTGAEVPAATGDASGNTGGEAAGGEPTGG